MAESKKTLTVTIQTKELKFAIMNKTHVTARSLEASGKLNYEASAHMQASEDSENSYELIRAISNAIAETKVELGEYLSEETSQTDNLIDSAIENGDAITINFLLPSNYNSAAADALGGGIHEFVVGRSIYEWYRQTCPEIAEACKADAEASLERAKKALYKRSRPTRPSYTTTLNAGTSITLNAGAIYDSSGTKVTVTNATTATLAANTTATLTANSNQVKLPAGTVLTLADSSTATLTADTFVLRVV